MTSAKRRAAASEALPLPAATSRTRSPARDVGRLGQRLADDLQRRADDGVVAAGPGGLLPLLDGGEVGSREHRSGVAVCMFMVREVLEVVR